MVVRLNFSLTVSFWWWPSFSVLPRLFYVFWCCNTKGTILLLMLYLFLLPVKKEKKVCFLFSFFRFLLVDLKDPPVNNVTVISGKPTIRKVKHLYYLENICLEIWGRKYVIIFINSNNISQYHSNNYPEIVIT